MNVRVSVVVPIYNAEKYLEKSIKSILRQSLKEIEILCINDGATDGSLEILKNLNSQDQRIRIFSHKNKGVGYTRNLGIRKALGEFIFFLDPDDSIPESDILERLYLQSSNVNALICGGEFSIFHEETQQIQSDFSNELSGYLFSEEGWMDYKDYQFDYGFHRFLYNRKFLLDNNIFFPELIRFQDPPFFVEAMIEAKRFYRVDYRTYLYQLGHQDIKWNRKRIFAVLEGLFTNIKMAKENGLYNLEKLSVYRINHEYFGLISSRIKYDLNLYIYLKKIQKHLGKEVELEIIALKNLESKYGIFTPITIKINRIKKYIKKLL